MKRRFLLGLGVALSLGVASGGCGNDERAPAVRVVDLPGASLSVAVGEGAVWVANFDDDTASAGSCASTRRRARSPTFRT